MSEPSTVPLRTLQQQARAAMQANQWPQAVVLLHQAARQSSAREADYLPVLADLRHALVRQRMARAALTVDWYRGDRPAQAELLGQVPLADQARTLQAWGELSEEPEKARQHYLGAADLYEQAGLGAQCAIARERAGDWAGARSLWSRLGQVLSMRPTEEYAEGLARFNLARCCLELGDAPAAHAAVVSSVHQLEAAADRYERGAERERAFDCYQVLIAIGRKSQQFEHVLEGYVNVSRILRQDHLRYYAIQSTEEAIDAARQAGELAAGATLAHELATYAEAQGLPSVANHGARLRAELWRDVARQAVERGAPAEIAENALLAAIVTLARQGQFQSVGTLYATLGELDLEPARKQHYTRASLRYQGVSDLRLDAGPLPAHLRQETPYPEVWHVDLVEWEQEGNAAAACGDVVIDRKSYSEITRRLAMLARLSALELETVEGRAPADAALAGLAELLGRVELYTILSPLERLFRSPSAPVRLAVMRAMQRLMFKRTFVTARQALADPDGTVRAQACKTVEALRFPHAFDPLGRIVREAADPEARAAALRAIARIDTAEAAELLLGVFQHEAGLERRAALDALKRARGTAFLELARRSWPSLGREAQASIREIFQARGETL